MTSARVKFLSTIFICATIYFAKRQFTKVEASNSLELEVSTAWNKFVMDHGKLYADQETHKLRYGIFRDNYLMIKKSNEQSNKFTLAVNKWADLTHDEFLDKFGVAEHSLDEEEVDGGHPMNIEQLGQGPVTPKKVNWKTQLRAGTVRDIEKCYGASNLMSAVSILESHVAIARNRLVKELSSQSVLDCMANTRGCQGDVISNYLSHLMKKGTVERWDYKWKAKLQQCQNQVFNYELGQGPVTKKYKLKNYWKTTQTADKTYPQNIYKAPILVSFSLSP